MDKILVFASSPAAIAAVQWLLGWLVKPRLKGVEAQVKLTGWVNVLNYFVGVIGFAIVPKELNAASLLDPLIGGGSIFLAAFGQNLMVTGIHSTVKNTLKPALLFTAKALFSRWIKF